MTLTKKICADVCNHPYYLRLQILAKYFNSRQALCRTIARTSTNVWISTSVDLLGELLPSPHSSIRIQKPILFVAVDLIFMYLAL